MAAKTIAIANQKGGVGKTTTALNIGVGLANEGKCVLLVDIDAQANLTMSLGFDPDELPLTICDLLQGAMNQQQTPTVEDCLLHAEGVDLIPSDMNLSGVEALMQTMSMGRESILKGILEPLGARYDFILIDCPPSLSTLTINALTAADEVIIPSQAQIFSFKGSSLLINNIVQVKKVLNPNLKVRGILITMLNERARNSQEIVQNIESVYGEHIQVFASRIPQSVRASESNHEGRSIYLHDPNGKIASAYSGCVKELLYG